jgi:broad specificity phosphatase PhoE
MIKEIYLIRHGETSFNRLGIVQGSGINSELNPIGWSQAREFYQYYSHIPFDIAYVSNLIRTEQTISPFIERGLPYIIDDKIREISWGIFEGQSYSEVLREEYHKMIMHWTKGDLHYALEGGESLAELINRCALFLKGILSPENRNEKFLICTHGRTLRCLVCLLTNQAFSQMEIYKPHNTGLFTFDLSNNGVVLKEINSTAHLATQKTMVH